MKKAIVATLAVAALAAAGCMSQGKTQGQKDIDKLSSAIDNLAKTVQQSKSDLELTIAAHDAVVAGQGDLPKLYSEFTKGLDKCKKDQASVAKQVADVKAAATARFAQWEKDIAAIGSEDLKKRSQERMDQTKKNYESVVALGEKAMAAYGPLMTTLGDHATYWASDLSPASAKSLASDNESVKKNATTIYGVLDQVVAAANTYTEKTAMKTEPEPAASTQPAEAAKKSE